MSSSSSNVGVAIVTGSNKGLGFSIVKKLCKDFKGKVYLTSRDETKGRLACEEIRKELNETPSVNDNPSFHQLDVTDVNSIKKFVKHIQDNNEQVEILVNNAQIRYQKDSSEPKMFQAERIIFVNFIGLVDLTEEILPFIKHGGKIVNITSSSGHLSRIPSSVRSQFRGTTASLFSKKINLTNLKTLVNRYIEDVKQDIEISTKVWGDSPYVISKVAVNAYTYILYRSMIDPHTYSDGDDELIENPDRKFGQLSINCLDDIFKDPFTAPLTPSSVSLQIPQNEDYYRGIIVNCVHPGYVSSDITSGAGSVTPEEAAALPVKLALTPWGAGLYVWHNGTEVLWEGEDPRVYIDGRKLKQ